MVTGGAEQVRHRVSAGADQRVGAIIAWLLLMLFFSVAAGVSDGDTGAIKKGRVQDDAPTRPVEPRGRRSQGEPGPWAKYECRPYRWARCRLEDPAVRVLARLYVADMEYINSPSL